jgi:hypothetical protein
MPKLKALLMTVLLLSACHRFGGEPFPPGGGYSVHRRFVYASRATRIDFLSMTAGHQVLIAPADDPLRPLPCYRARSLDPSIFTLSLPDGTVVPDPAVCRPFGLGDSFFGEARRAGTTAVEIRDETHALDEISITVSDARDIELVGVPGRITLDLGKPYQLTPRLVALDGAPVGTGTSAWTQHIADPRVALFDDGAAEVTTYRAVIRPVAVGTTTLTLTVGSFMRDIPLAAQASQ